MDASNRIHYIGSQGLSSKRQRCLNRFSGQAGMGVKNLFDGFAGRQLFQNKLDGDARPGDDRFTHHYRWVGHNQLLHVHSPHKR